MELENSATNALQEQNKNLRNQVEFLESIIDSMPFIVFVKNKDSQYIYTNKFCENVNHVEKGGLLGKSDLDIWHSKEIAESYRKRDLELLETKKGSRVIIPTLDNNEINYQESFKQIVYDKNQNVTGIIGITIPPAEKNLLLDFQKEHADDYKQSLIMDYHLNTKKIISLKTCENFTSYDNKEIPFDSLATDEGGVHPQDVKMIASAYMKIIDSGESTPFFIKLKNDAGEYVLCNVVTKCIYSSDNKMTRISIMITPLSNTKNLRSRTIEVDSKIASYQIMDLISDDNEICMYMNEEFDYF